MTVSDYTPGSGLPPLVLYAWRKSAADESPIPKRNCRLVRCWLLTLRVLPDSDQFWFRATQCDNFL